MNSQTVLLHPRPYAHHSGSLILLPLLPTKRVNAAFPIEIWTQIFEEVGFGRTNSTHSLSLLLVCKKFKDIALPLLYSRVSFEHYEALEKFCIRIHEAESKWDSLRRIPYSAPGRWVQSLDIHRLELCRHTAGRRLVEDIMENMALTLRLDSLLSNLFPVLPFLSEFYMNPRFTFSRRALMSMNERQTMNKLRSLRGISYTPSYVIPGEALVDLLRNCPGLEELEVIGPDVDPVDHDLMASWYGPTPFPPSFEPLYLPNLRELTLLASLQLSPLMLCLLSTPLPSLSKLTIAPDDDIPFPTSSPFVSSHGHTLRSLLLLTRKSWPTRLHASPTTLLRTSPVLKHLSLEVPLPALELNEDHHLEILSIPKPSHDSWAFISRLLLHLPSLKAVRIRDVKWLRKGMGLRAMETGVQGEMREWRRRLARRGIKILDGEWKEGDSV
ncbi:hypothetical protein EV361DRAFT_875134 [Lentinula raphanica]|uniref:F-box domain-containing protein n=1 Tax=Lentinula raphanica TaxID=153919 RepID=A0AA38PLY0_9AGAR|nr:hypothetical protein F5878DRAFT_599548 [Lentinula raphanica]KAJ3978105.1 hypothetical protein EV361DRAFT_875134 [Lentinula raphanica]